MALKRWDSTKLRSIPGRARMSTEDFAESAELAGLSYEALMQRIISLGRRWESERYR